MGAVLYQLTLFQTQDFRVILVGTIYGKYNGLIIEFLPRGDSVMPNLLCLTFPTFNLATIVLEVLQGFKLHR